MRNPILRTDIFPFSCQNQDCGEQYSIDDFMAVISRYGLVYADCGNVIYQGVNCPKCRKTSILELPRGNPLVDLRGFIIAPSQNPLNNPFEQILERERANDGYDYLKFKSIPAWDETTVSYHDMLAWYKLFLPSFQSAPIGSYWITPIQLKMSLNIENNSGKAELRRLYLDTPKFRNLLTCISHNSVNEVIPGVGLKAEYKSTQEWHESNKAWSWMLEEALGKSLNEAVQEAAKYHIASKVDLSDVDDLIDQHRHLIWLNQSYARQYLQNQALKIGFEDKIYAWEGWQKLFDDFFMPIGTDLAMTYHRKRLFSWVDKVKPGQALFVDAPMGIGKSHSIVETLATNPDLSAVIFMPTNSLCEDLINKLTTRIGQIRNLKYRNQVEIHNGVPHYKLIEFAEDVYFADGINEECKHYKEIIGRYRRYWFKKADICGVCEKYNMCRFRKHKTKAPLKRIVVTTHHQYDRFTKLPNMRKWFKDGYYEKDDASNKIKKEGTPRNFFIIDEDIILSQCYQPIGLSSDDFKVFIGTFVEFLENMDEEPRAIRDIFNFYAQIELCEETAFVQPVNRNFKIKSKIKQAWEKSVSEISDFMPEVLERTELVGNHILVLENAIRKGATVQLHSGREKMVYLPNYRSYDLSNLPPHVFFDGTMIPKKFLRKKLKGVNFKKMEIKFNPLWELNVWQNTNTNLPMVRIADDEYNVKQFIWDILHHEDKFYRKWLFITTKAIRYGYLEEFLKESMQHIPYTVMTYGNLRGINEAKDSDVCFMIGGFMLSDAVEIAMATDFFQHHKISFDDRWVIPKNQLWTWQKNKGVRSYRQKYSFIEKLAQAYRFAEYRQALARTRYLYHNVDFYILATDQVDDFEPYLPKAKESQYRADSLFPPRPPHPNKLETEVKDAILKFLQEYEVGTDSVISRETPHSRTTIRKYRRELYFDKIIERVGKIKYRLSKDKIESG